jgi:hypothetical protein
MLVEIFSKPLGRPLGSFGHEAAAIEVLIDVDLQGRTQLS